MLIIYYNLVVSLLPYRAKFCNTNTPPRLEVSEFGLVQKHFELLCQILELHYYVLHLITYKMVPDVHVLSSTLMSVVLRNGYRTLKILVYRYCILDMHSHFLEQTLFP